MGQDATLPTATGSGQPSMLMVTTVSATLRAFLVPYAEYLRGQGWRVDAAASGAPADDMIRAAFDDVHDLSLTRSIRDLQGIVRGFSELVGLLGSAYDIVHVHTPIAAFATRAAAARVPASARPAVVYTAHGFHFHQDGHPIPNRVFRLVEQVCGRWTNRLVVINQEDADAAVRYRIVPRRHVLLMPGIGIDTDWYAPAAVAADDVLAARTRHGIDPSDPVFVTVGELNDNKRPGDVIEALASVPAGDVHAVFLGTGPRQQELEALALERGLADRVHFLGAVDDVRPYVAGASALVHVSRREGLPRVIMEALSLGVPVVCTAARGSRELVQPDSGFVVPIGDVASITSAMVRILDDPGAAREMGAAGRERMVQRYDLGVLLSQHGRMYRELLDERNRRQPAD